MRRIRIGNQISLQWEIFNGDTAYDLLERTNKVFLVAAMIKQQVEFTLSGEHHNIINVVWAGADQKFCGEYHLLLVSNENEVNMFSLDSKPCLVLTPVTEHDAENRAVTVELTDNIYLPTSGESLYEMMVRTGRFEGTEEEFLQQYVDTLNNADAATTRANTAAANADDARVALTERANADHTRAVNDHSTAASDHTTAGTDHTRAESDHSTAASDHTTAGTDHTRAESDHSTAASDHTQAGTDHTRAESDHSTAASDHTRAESDHNAAIVGMAIQYAEGESATTAPESGWQDSIPSVEGGHFLWTRNTITLGSGSHMVYYNVSMIPVVTFTQQTSGNEYQSKLVVGGTQVGEIDIVDDDEDDSGNKALSAKQGKILAERITAIEGNRLFIMPTGLQVESPTSLTIGNIHEHFMTAKILPASAYQNVLFIADNKAVSVEPDGRIIINAVGHSLVHVIPVANPHLFKTIGITVHQPYLRKVAVNTLRFRSDGTLSLT